METKRPLVIDLDGTLLNTDILLESALQLIKKEPFSVISMLPWLMRGKAYLKHKLAEKTTIDVEILPYNNQLLEWISQQKATGRKIILATATNEKFANTIARYLNVFDNVYASDETNNLSGSKKRKILVECFGEYGFDYAANHSDDLPIWQIANTAILVNTPARLEGRLRKLARKNNRGSSIVCHDGLASAAA